MHHPIPRLPVHPVLSARSFRGSRRTPFPSLTSVGPMLRFTSGRYGLAKALMLSGVTNVHGSPRSRVQLSGDGVAHTLVGCRAALLSGSSGSIHRCRGPLSSSERDHQVSHRRSLLRIPSRSRADSPPLQRAQRRSHRRLRPCPLWRGERDSPWAEWGTSRSAA